MSPVHGYCSCTQSLRRPAAPNAAASTSSGKLKRSAPSDAPADSLPNHDGGVTMTSSLPSSTTSNQHAAPTGSAAGAASDSMDVDESVQPSELKSEAPSADSGRSLRCDSAIGCVTVNSHRCAMCQEVTGGVKRSKSSEATESKAPSTGATIAADVVPSLSRRWIIKARC